MIWSSFHMAAILFLDWKKWRLTPSKKAICILHPKTTIWSSHSSHSWPPSPSLHPTLPIPPPFPSLHPTLPIPPPHPSYPSTPHFKEQVQQWKLETPKKKKVFPSDSQLNQSSTAKEYKRSSLYLSPVHELGEFTGLSAGTKNYTEL